MFRGSLVYLIPIFVLLFLGLVLNQVQKNKPQTLGATLSPIATPQATVLPSPTPTPSPSPTILQKSAAPSSSPNNSGPSNSQVSGWKYPNSILISESTNALSLESSDDPTTITNWYKSKIQSSGMSVKTFVTTNNNDNILNKLSGASGSTGVLVEVSKNSGDSIVKISVKL